MGDSPNPATIVTTRDGDTVEVRRLVSTRVALHQLAEHVLAADLHRHTGRIGLRRTPGGFGTPSFERDGQMRQIRVEGTNLVVDDAGDTRSAPITTLRAAGRLLDIEPGGPAAVYRLATPLDLDAPLDVDARAAALIAGWFATVDVALERLAAAHPDESPTERQLWPEHFDLALTMSETNYGGSPGDDGHDLPYLYVGPWTRREGAFWNESFGASRPWHADSGPDDAIGFLHDGHALLRATAPR